MTKSLDDLLDDYGDACYSSTDEAWAVRREITKLFDSRQKQKPIAYITGWYGGYPTIKILDGAVLPNGTPLYAAPPERKPIGYIPRYSAGIIKRDGMWDACTLYRTKVDPTDVEVFL